MCAVILVLRLWGGLGVSWRARSLPVRISNILAPPLGTHTLLFSLCFTTASPPLFALCPLLYDVNDFFR